MKKLIFCILIFFIAMLPAVAFANPLPSIPRTPCQECSSCFLPHCNKPLEELEKDCINRCAVCKDSPKYDEIKQEFISWCNKQKCASYCLEVCSDCENNEFKTVYGCEDCNHLCQVGDLESYCKDTKCLSCSRKCLDSKTLEFKIVPECDECRQQCDGANKPNYYDLRCEQLCVNNCFNCHTHYFKATPECAVCRMYCDNPYPYIESYYGNGKFVEFCKTGKNIDWCANRCFDCHTNSYAFTSIYCTVCDYTIDELKSKCPQIDPTTNTDNQPQANAEQPQANAEQAQANAEQSDANTERSMRKTKSSCSAAPYMPLSSPIAWLMILLASLVLLCIGIKQKSRS